MCHAHCFCIFESIHCMIFLSFIRFSIKFYLFDHAFLNFLWKLTFPIIWPLYFKPKTTFSLLNFLHFYIRISKNSGEFSEYLDKRLKTQNFIFWVTRCNSYRILKKIFENLWIFFIYNTIYLVCFNTFDQLPVFSLWGNPLSLSRSGILTRPLRSFFQEEYRFYLFSEDIIDFLSRNTLITLARCFF